MLIPVGYTNFKSSSCWLDIIWTQFVVELIIFGVILSFLHYVPCLTKKIQNINRLTKQRWSSIK